MSNNFEKLKSEIDKLYPTETISNDELNQMTWDLTKFFAIGIKSIKKDIDGNENA